MVFLTNLKFEPKGRHDPAQAYSVTDTVTAANGSAAYTAVKNVPVGIELSNTAYWVKILDLEDVRSSAEMAASDAILAAKTAMTASKSGISTIVKQDFPADQRDMAQENIGLKEIVRGITDGRESTGNPVICRPVEGILFDKVETIFSPVQAAGDAAPDNILPISSLKNLNLARIGKNWINPAWYKASKTENGVTFTANPDGTILLNGTATDTTMFDLFVGADNNGKSYLMPNQTYTISFGSAFAAIPGEARMVVGYQSPTDDSWRYPVYETYGMESKTFTLPNNAAYTMVRLRLSAGDVCDNVLVTPQIELGSVATAFEPYLGDTYSVQISGTVYGGKMNWLTGELIADWVMETFDGTESWKIISGAHLYFYRNIGNFGTVVSDQGRCSHYTRDAISVSINGPYNRFNVINTSVNSGYARIQIRPDMTLYPNVDAWKTYLAEQYAEGTPVQIAYKLTSPQILHLNAQHISANQGANTLFGSGDAIVVGYRTAGKNAAADEQDRAFAERLEKHSDGHLKAYDTSGADGYIKCPKRLFMQFDEESAGIYLCFFKNVDGEYVQDNSILGDGVLVIGNNDVPGNTIDLPEGLYMQAYTEGDAALYGWDGVEFGPAVSGDLTTTAQDGKGWTVMDSKGMGGITLPNDAKAIICTGKGCVSAIWGVKKTPDFNFETTPATHDVLLAGPTRFFRFPENNPYIYFKLTFCDDYDFKTGKANGMKTITGDLRDHVCVVRDTARTHAALGRAKQVIDTARKLCNIKWTAMANSMTTNEAGTYYFKEGVTYNGLPYASGYTRAHFIGYHVSLHTFLNAVNDPDSIIYREQLGGGAPYYSVVCSTFTAMAAGWPVPVSNAGYLYDPNVVWHMANTPSIGDIWSNIYSIFGESHCVIPERIDWNDENTAMSVYEATGAISSRTTRYSNIARADMNGIYREAQGESYYDNYGISVHYLGYHMNDGVPYLDFSDLKVVNGSARPYKGDKSVYTSDDEYVLVNIKNASATKLYMQKRGAYNATEIGIAAGTKQVDVKTHLDGAGIYEVWADGSGSVRESFEYVEVSLIKWTFTEDSISFDKNEFWYAQCQVNGHPLLKDKDGNDMTAGKHTPVMCSDDYSRWFEGGKRITSVMTIFGKGEYGAYVIPDKKQTKEG